MNKFYWSVVIGVVLVVLTGCNRLEHGVNKIQKQLTSQNPTDIPSIIVNTEKLDVRVNTLLTDLYLPWSLTAMADGSLLVTEKNGTLYRYYPATAERHSISNLPASKLWGQGGLMDIVLHPDFDKNQWLYLSYSTPVEAKLAALQVTRARLVGNKLTELQVVFTASPGINSGAHFGGAMVFGGDGYLYITSGERGSRPLVQELDNHIGKIIRIKDDGSVPPDNPYQHKTNAMAEIFSLGHRNPQGIGIEPVSQEIWAVEHGPRGGDEINVIVAGKNYGWPVISHGVEYDSQQPIGEGSFKVGMEQPLYYYVPSIATAGMSFYQGAPFTQWHGNLLIAALSGKHISRLEIVDGAVTHEEKILNKQGKRIRDVEQGADGLIYVLTDGGELLQLQPAEQK